MLCNKCNRKIAEDSLFCSYCGAEQPRPAENEHFEQYEDTQEPMKPPSFLRRLFGWVVAIALLAALACILYALSSGEAPILSNWGTVMD